MFSDHDQFTNHDSFLDKMLLFMYNYMHRGNYLYVLSIINYNYLYVLLYKMLLFMYNYMHRGNYLYVLSINNYNIR